MSIQPVTNRSPKIGLFLPASDGPPELGWKELVSLARRAEELGFNSLWLPDHVLLPLGTGQPLGVWECWTHLAGLAVVTDRVELGTLVTSTSYRNPALIAKMAETVDAMSGGRLILGVGAGHVEAEARSFGFPYDHRASRFEEAIQIITGLLRERRVDFNGTYYTAQDCELRPPGPRPQGPPVMVGANGPRMIRLAARYADEFNVDTGTTPDTIGDVTAMVDAACREVGRDPASLRRSAFVMIDITSPTLPGDECVRDLFRNTAFTGTPAELAGMLRAYAAAGCEQVQVWLNPTTMAGIEAFAPVLALLDAESA